MVVPAIYRTESKIIHFLVVISMSVQCRNEQVSLHVNCPVATGVGATARTEAKVSVEMQRTQICFTDVVLGI